MAALLPGFAPVFAGWNVWDVYQKDNLDFELSMLGLDHDRRLRIWVENATHAAPGAQVTDEVDPNKPLVGDQVQILPNPGSLVAAVRKESVPGPALLLDSQPTKRTVRFYNRGGAAVLPWPHDANYLLDAVYEPTATNELTNAPPPANPLANAASTLLTVAEIVGGLLLAIVVVQQVRR
jgi:hypothetical protein